MTEETQEGHWAWEGILSSHCLCQQRQGEYNGACRGHPASKLPCVKSIDSCTFSSWLIDLHDVILRGNRVCQM